MKNLLMAAALTLPVSVQAYDFALLPMDCESIFSIAIRSTEAIQPADGDTDFGQYCEVHKDKMTCQTIFLDKTEDPITTEYTITRLPGKNQIFANTETGSDTLLINLEDPSASSTSRIFIPESKILGSKICNMAFLLKEELEGS